MAFRTNSKDVKAAAKKAFLSGSKIALLACNANPYFLGNYPYITSIEKVNNNYDFDYISNSFMYYNCNSETGKYINYFLVSENQKIQPQFDKERR